MSPELKRRFSSVLKRKPAVASMIILGILLVTSVMSEWVTNSKPVMGVVNGKFVVPAYFDYNWEDVGQEGAGVVDYREIRKDFSWAIWPLIEWDPIENDTSLDLFMSPPSTGHIMGTDVAGRDVFARLLYGTRISFFFGLSVWIIAYCIGTVVGLFQGFLGGKVDMLGQRLVEIFASIPEFYLLLLLITLLTPNVGLLVAISSFFGWVGISQYMRAEALRNRNLAYNEAARSLGASKARILFLHILPNSLVPIVTLSPFSIVANITGLSALDMLGFGVPPPTPSWGELLDQARNNFQVAWWLAVFPSAFLFVSLTCLTMIGEALRAAFDPRA